MNSKLKADLYIYIYFFFFQCKVYSFGMNSGGGGTEVQINDSLDICDSVMFIIQIFTTIGLSARQIISCNFNQNAAVQCGNITEVICTRCLY
jgi:hypothetical protein